MSIKQRKGVLKFIVDWEADPHVVRGVTQQIFLDPSLYKKPQIKNDHNVLLGKAITDIRLNVEGKLVVLLEAPRKEFLEQKFQNEELIRFVIDWNKDPVYEPNPVQVLTANPEDLAANNNSPVGYDYIYGRVISNIITINSGQFMICTRNARGKDLKEENWNKPSIFDEIGLVPQEPETIERVMSQQELAAMAVAIRANQERLRGKGNG